MLIKDAAKRAGRGVGNLHIKLIFRLVTGCVHQPGKVHRSVREMAVQRPDLDRVSADVERGGRVMHHQLAGREGTDPDRTSEIGPLDGVAIDTIENLPQ